MMTRYQKISLIKFSKNSFFTSGILSFFLFAGNLISIISLTLAATIFSGLFGFLFGRYFPFLGKKAKLKAMLIGATIPTLAFIPSLAIFSLAFQIDYYGLDALFMAETYDVTEFMLTVGMGAAFVAPIIIPIGMYTGARVNSA